MLTRSKTPAWLMSALKRSVWPQIQLPMNPPYDPPAAATFDPSRKSYVFRAKSRPDIRSSYTLPVQSRLIWSVNFWPNPVEPRGLIATTAYPGAANIG